jgi:diacylglycerol kinase (ATP)
MAPADGSNEPTPAAPDVGTDDEDERSPRPAQHGLVASFRAAFAGIGRAVATQRNMKIHVVAGLMVSIVGMALPFDLSTRATLLFCIAIVLFAEILNTGLEALVDLYVGEFRRLAMLAKDAAAGGVLVLSFAVVLVFSDILITHWEIVAGNLPAVERSVLFGIPLVASEALGLSALRRGVKGALRALLSLGLLIPLARTSTDPVFTALALGLIALSYWARRSFPRYTGRGARKGTTP